MSIVKNIFWILLFINSLLNAQVIDKNLSFKKADFLKPKYKFSAGSNFIYVPSLRSGINIYAVPSISFALTQRLSAEAGIIATTSVMPGNFPYEINAAKRNYGNLAVFGSTIYQATPKLTIYGTGIKQLIDKPSYFPFPPTQPNSFTLGTSFKLSKGLTIGASFQISEGYYTNSFLPGRERKVFYSPFIW